MGRFSVIGCCVLAAACVSATADTMDPGDFNGPHMIINGPGYGTVLDLINGIINDMDIGHVGYVQDHNFGPHYHGYLFHNPDPNPSGIGWGNVAPYEMGGGSSNLDTNFVTGADVPISNTPRITIPDNLDLNSPTQLDYRDGIAAVTAVPYEPRTVVPGKSLTNQKEMVGWFETAVVNWQKKHALDMNPKIITNSSDDFGLWNFSQYLKRYGQEWEGDTDTYKQFITGREFELKKKIIAEHEKTGQKLNPGQVFGIALEMFEGDVFKALLCSHNTIRAIARGREPFFLPDQPAYSSTVTEVNGNKIYSNVSEDPTFGYSDDQKFFKDHLVQLTEGSTEILESSVWYHTFGTALAGMKFGGWGARRMVDMEDIYVDITTDTGRHPILNTTDYWGVEVGTTLDGLVETAEASPRPVGPHSDGIAPVR